MNNYESEGQCVDTAMQGACCYRTYSTALESIVQVDQQLEVRCQVNRVKTNSSHRLQLHS